MRGFVEAGVAEPDALELIRKSISIADDCRNNFKAKIASSSDSSKQRTRPGPFVVGSMACYGPLNSG